MQPTAGPAYCLALFYENTSRAVYARSRQRWLILFSLDVMRTFLNRSLSLLVYLAYIAAGFTHGGGAVALKLAISFLLPVACMWFPQPLGDYTGIIRGQLMTASTPAFLVCAGGWLVLIGVPLIAYAISRGI